MPDRASMTGRVLDKYEILEKVGEGGMAEVYRGRHLTLGREVAVKLLHPHLSSTERNRVRFEREARAIVSLEHDHILKIFDYSGKDSQLCYIVTEFIEGSTFKDLLTPEGKIPSEVAAMIALELCSALTFAHARGIIHRDIKPENVMVRQDGVVKLMDFGIARVLDDSTTTLTGGLVGSPAYMSPEQASDNDIDVRSDLFSLGTLLYRAVTGHLPFVGRSTPVILRNIIDGNYADPLDVEPGIDPSVAEIITRALATDPNERFSTAAEMGGELSAVLDRADMARGPTEIRRYFDDPAAYEAWLSPHLSAILAERGKKLIADGNSVAAMKLFNRVLYLDEHNEAVMSMIQGLHQAKRPLSRYLLATFFVLCIPLGAVVALGLSYRESLWPTPHAQVARSPDARVAPPLENPAPPPPLTPEPSPASSPAPASEGMPPLAPAFTESRVLPLRSLNLTGDTNPRRPPRERVPGSPTPAPTGKPVKTPRRASLPIGSPSTTEATMASLNIHTNVPADIKIDGRLYGNSMLLKDPIALPPGTYHVVLSNKMCREREETIHLTPGQRADPFYELTVLPARLHLHNFDPGTELFLDDEPLGLFASLSQPIQIREPRSKHTLRAKLADGNWRKFPIKETDPNSDVQFDGGAR